MQCIIAQQAGGPEVLQFEERANPALQPQQVLIAVKAIGVNRADSLQRQGKYPPPAGESDIIGLEVSGEIIELGEGVAKAWKGKRVAALVAGGGYADIAVADLGCVYELPTGLSDEQGAGMLETFTTAYQTLCDLGQINEQSTVLIHAGASGVGTSAIQLAKQRGATVICTVGSDEKAAFCAKLGADHTINYKKSDFTKVIRTDLGLKVDVALDCVGGDYINRDISVMAMDGKIISIAMMGGRFSEPLDLAKLLAKRITLQGSTLRNQPLSVKTRLIRGLATEFAPAFAKQHIAPIIDKVLPWQQVQQAHEYLESNQSKGKVILRIES